MFGQIIGFSTTYETSDESFYKYYQDLDPSHWSRIKDISLMLSDHLIGPKVIKITDQTDDNKISCIEYQKVVPFSFKNHLIRPNLTIAKIRGKISALVDKLHGLGYAHGDLHMCNLGFIGTQMFILDHDTIYKISDGPVPWLSLWMKDGFNWAGSFEEFVKYDYINWQSDWLS